MVFHYQPNDLIKKLTKLLYAFILSIIIFSLSARAMEKDENISSNLSQVSRPAAKASYLDEWSTTDPSKIESWVENIKSKKVREIEPGLSDSVRKFQELIENDAEVFIFINQMISSAVEEHKNCGHKEENIIKDYNEMLYLINEAIKQAPDFNDSELVGFPINTILNWTMGTPAGFSIFLNTKVNEHIRGILKEWCGFLESPASRHVLHEGENGWMCEKAKEKIKIEDYEHDPKAQHWGFKSWNDFFIREFKEKERPVAEGDDIIVSACESTPYQIEKSVKEFSTFWVKSQEYSLRFMLDGHHVDEFIGGTVYQAFLSAHNYHRWHSPVSGTIKEIYVKPGSYYAGAYLEKPDPAAPNLSQKYITHTATRGILFIESETPQIGLMCFMPVGMAEVSSCIFTVEEGQKVKKGDPLGYFQFGGSTYCLIFPGNVKLKFSSEITDDSEGKSLKGNLVKVNSEIAKVQLEK